jgi:hypothetical protein
MESSGVWAKGFHLAQNTMSSESGQSGEVGYMGEILTLLRPLPSVEFVKNTYPSIHPEN